MITRYDLKVLFATVELIPAIESGNLKKLVQSIAQGANVNDPYPCGNTPLHVAVKKQDKEAIQLLLRRGGNPNSYCHRGFSPLDWAARLGNIEIAKLLLAAGADINERKGVGYSPLLLAVQGGKYKMINFLLGEGAEINPTETVPPLVVVFQHKEGKEMLELLIKHGADYENKNRIQVRKTRRGALEKTFQPVDFKRALARKWGFEIFDEIYAWQREGKVSKFSKSI